jgi:hypothetical protein
LARWRSVRDTYEADEGEIDGMDPDVLLASDPEALAERIAGQYEVGVPSSSATR